MKLPNKRNWAARLRKAAGFTLIELLVSVGIMASLLVLLIQLVGNIVQSWGHANSILIQNSESALCMDYIAKDMGSAMFRDDGAVWFIGVQEPIEKSGSMPEMTTAFVRFFSTATDRGSSLAEAASTQNLGNLTAIGYRIYKINTFNPDSDSGKIYGLYRFVVNPRLTFDEFQGKLQSKDADAFMAAEGDKKVTVAKSFLASNLVKFDMKLGYKVKTDLNGNGLADDVKELTISSTPVSFPLFDGEEKILRPDYVDVTFYIISEAGRKRLDALAAGQVEETLEQILLQETRAFGRRILIESQGI